MSVKFDYTAQLRNSYLLTISSSAGFYASKGTTAVGEFFEMFRALFNPGHQNNSSAFEYSLQAYFQDSGSSFKWEFRPNGSAVWTKFSTGFAALDTTSRRTGTYETSAVALPMTIKLSGKTSTIGGAAKISNWTTWMCVIRAWGPVAT